MLTWVLDTFNIYCHVILCSAFVRMSDGEFYELCCGFSSFAGLCCGILRFCFLVLFQNDVAAFDHLILLWSLNVFSLSAIPLSDFSFGLDTLESACLCKHLLCVWVNICVWLSLCFSFYCHNVCIFSHMMITSSPVFSVFFSCCQNSTFTLHGSNDCLLLFCRRQLFQAMKLPAQLWNTSRH